MKLDMESALVTYEEKSFIQSKESQNYVLCERGEIREVTGRMLTLKTYCNIPSSSNDKRNNMFMILLKNTEEYFIFEIII